MFALVGSARMPNALLERARMPNALLERAGMPNIERSECLADAKWQGPGYNQST